jgi:hypothetical protein
MRGNLFGAATAAVISTAAVLFLSNLNADPPPPEAEDYLKNLA